MRIFAAAHDAGGAGVVAAWLHRRQRAGDEVVCLASGPAEAVAAARLGSAALTGEVPALEAFDLVVCGSSLVADLERRVVSAARRAGTPSAVWLDHWVHFAARLDELPDEVWVCDEWAERLAGAELPGVPVLVKGNPYLDDLAAAVRALPRPRTDRQHVLYVTEPVSSVSHLPGPGAPAADLEVAALDRYLAEQRGPGTVVRLRLHPAEPPEKYAAVVARHAAAVGLETGVPTTLVEDCAWADVVVGWQTTAMVVALHSGRRVLSVAPSDGPGPALPHPRQRLDSRATPWSLSLDVPAGSRPAGR